jgi:hypothetical protein
MAEERPSPPYGVNRAVEEYNLRLRQFADSADLPLALFEEPDHLMIKTADPVDFEQKVQEIKPWAKPWSEEGSLAFIEMDWRFLVAAQLLVPYVLHSRRAGILEIMEAKGDEGRDYLGVEYGTFYCNDVYKTQRIVNSSGIKSDVNVNEAHNWRWLNVPINNHGQEVRFSDTKIIEIVETELEDGTAKLI